MLLRALVELWMMYVSTNWIPQYGIAHNFFTFFLNIGLLSYFKTKSKIKLTFIFLTLLFLIESYFAFYMLKNIKSNSAVYFVPNEATHENLLFLTLVVIMLCAIWQVYFLLNWRKERI